jgi:hypothetical protein
MLSNEGAFAPEPFRQSPRNVAQSHTGRLEVFVGSAVPVLEYKAPFIIQSLRVEVRRTAGNGEEATPPLQRRVD